MSFSYIIAYRHSEDRFKNLKTVLNWIKETGCEIIIVEQDVESKIRESELDININKILISNNYPFNKSWCFNVGWKNAKFDKIVFGDADLVMDINSLKSSIQHLDIYDVVNPYSSVVDLTEFETNNFISSKNIEDLFKITRPGRGETDHQKVPFCGGIIMFNKLALENLKGWSEDFWGWGAEDDFMSIKSQMFQKCFQNKERCFHLFHQKAPVYHNLYMRNFYLYSELVKLNQFQMRSYLDSITEIGNINKKIN